MSNRLAAQDSALAALKISHEMQIEALTAPSLTCMERISRFLDAIEASEKYRDFFVNSFYRSYSAARACWYTGSQEKSLFSLLPGCECPVIEKHNGRLQSDLIPSRLPDDWSPTREVLEEFARIQQHARFPNR